jgi:hypothetical protein
VPNHWRKIISRTLPWFESYADQAQMWPMSLWDADLEGLAGQQQPYDRFHGIGRLDQRFLSANHIRRPRQVYRTKYGRLVAIDMLDAGHNAFPELLF